MNLCSAHAHPLLSGLTLIMQEGGCANCLRLDEYDHPVHTIEATVPVIRKRKCDERFDVEEVRVSPKFCRYMRPSSVKEHNHRQHSRRDMRRAPKILFLEQMVA